MVKKWEGGFIWIPRPYKPTWKILIDTTDVSDDILPGGMEFNYPVTDSIGRFKIELDNSQGTYNNLTGGESIYIYLDHDVTPATTLQFRGVLELPKFNSRDGFEIITLEGVHVSGHLLDITVTKQVTTPTACSTVLKEIIDNFAPDFTYVNVETTTATMEVNWENKPFWACVIDICSVAGTDCYVDNTRDFHMFAENSKETDLDAIVWDDNLIDNEGLGDSIEDVKNKVVVNGADAEGLPIVYETEDSTSDTAYDTRTRIIDDTSIDTYAEAKERGDAELSILKNPLFKGTTNSFLLTYMDGAGTSGHGGPGYKIWISIPTIQLQSQYKVTNLVHKLDSNFIFTTELSVQKPFKLPQYFRDRLTREIASEKINNPGQMKFTFNLTFDISSDISTHSNTELFGGVLRCSIDSATSNRYTTGTAITAGVEADSNITKCDLRISAHDGNAGQFYVSNTDGSIWEQINYSALGNTHTFSSIGKKLRLKIVLNSTTDYPTPEINSLVCMYK